VPSIVAELKASTGEFMAKMGEARAEVGKLSTDSASHMEKLQTVGKAAFLGLAGAAVAGGAMAIKAAGSYQESLTQLVTGAGESEKNIKMVGDGMLHMAGQVGISADDLSKGMYMIESAGFHGANGLSVLKAAAEGARVGGADMTVVADGLTTALNDYHLPASAAAEVTSKLVATVASGKTHMADLAGSLAQVLPAASAAHVGLDQVLGAMATMTSQGTPAADAATYLRQAIIKLSVATPASAKEMESLGINAIDLQQHLGDRGLTGTLKIMTDAIAKHMGPAGLVMVDALQKSSKSAKGFQTAISKLPPEQQTYVAALSKMMGGAKTLQAALQLTGTGAQTFNDNVKKISATTVEAGGHVVGFGLTQKDLNTQLANMKAATESVVIEIGQKLIPIVTEVIVWIQKHGQAAKELAIVVGSVLALAIASYVGGLIVAAAQSVASFTMMIARGAVWVATSVAQFAGWIAAQAASVATSLALWAMYAGEWIASQAAAAATWLAQQAVAGVTWLAENAARLAVFLAAQVAAAAAMVATWVAANIGMILAMGAIGLAIAAVAIAAYEVYKHWDQIWGWIKQTVEDAWTWIKAHLAIVVPAAMALILGPIGLLIGVLITHWGEVEQGVTEAWDTVKRLTGEAWAAVKSAVVTAVGDVVTYVGSIPGKVLATLGDLSSLLFDAGRNIIQGLINGIGSMIGAVGGAVRNVASGALNSVKGFLGIHSPSTVFHEIGVNVVQGLANGINAHSGVAAGAMDDLAGMVGGFSGGSVAMGFSGSGSAGTGASAGSSVVIGQGAFQLIVQGSIDSSSVGAVNAHIDRAFEALRARLTAA
jgi:TP901 family phage tail tape measure protein